MNKLIVSIALTAFVVVGGAFYGGMQYAQAMNKKGSGQLGMARGTFQGQGNGGRGVRAAGVIGGGGFAGGEVLSKDDKSVTVKLRDGGSQIIFFSDTTQVGKSVSGSKDDLKVGEQITVTGESNKDGSVTAQFIQIRPAMPVGAAVDSKK